MQLENAELYYKIRHLLHYFEPVSLTPISPNIMPVITYSRLTQHYEPIIKLCKILLEHSSLHLGREGEIPFSSFLVNMNELFEKFLVGCLRERLVNKGYQVKGGKRKEEGYSDEEKRQHI